MVVCVCVCGGGGGGLTEILNSGGGGPRAISMVCRGGPFRNFDLSNMYFPSPAPPPPT